MLHNKKRSQVYSKMQSIKNNTLKIKIKINRGEGEGEIVKSVTLKHFMTIS